MLPSIRAVCKAEGNKQKHILQCTLPESPVSRRFLHAQDAHALPRAAFERDHAHGNALARLLQKDGNVEAGDGIERRLRDQQMQQLVT